MLSLANDIRPAYILDANDRIAFVNAAWLIFARGAQGAVADDILGEPIWRILGDGETRLLWELLHRRVRAAGAPLFVPMRVDVANERRLIDIELRPLAERSIVHICEPVWAEERAAVALLDPSWPRDERTVRACTWCNRVQVGLAVWLEIEAAQAALGIEAAGALPTLVGDACFSCKQSLLKTFPARVA